MLTKRSDWWMKDRSDEVNWNIKDCHEWTTLIGLGQTRTAMSDSRGRQWLRASTAGEFARIHYINPYKNPTKALCWLATNDLKEEKRETEFYRRPRLKMLEEDSDKRILCRPRFWRPFAFWLGKLTIAQIYFLYTIHGTSTRRLRVGNSLSILQNEHRDLTPTEKC